MSYRFPTSAELDLALTHIKGKAHRTPVMTNSYINSLLDADCYFKCENFQKAGAYKIRGAINAIMHLTEEQRAKGVATHSSGNFAQAVAIGARILGISAHVIMPDNAPEIKRVATEGYGATIYQCASTLAARESTMADVVSKTGASPLHPSNQREVIIGQGTVAHELLTDHPGLDAIYTPVGGGGLIAGTCINKYLNHPGLEIFGGEPEQADDAYRSLKAGKILPSIDPDTIADGLRTQLGDQNFPIIKRYVNAIITVSEDDIIRSMRMVWERMKIIIEPSSAVTVAALIKNKTKMKGKKIGVIISGGNVDLNKLPF